MAGELISRAELDRIIRRAAELQTGEREIGEGLTEAEVLSLGRDVGIPARYLRQALLEERTRPEVAPAQGAWGWLAGPTRLAAARVVPGERPTVERALDRWMQEEELLQVKRRYADRTTWEPQAGAFATIRRALGTGGRTYALARATEVGSEVTALEPGFCHVTLAADVRAQRKGRIAGATTLVVFGSAVAGAVSLAGLPLLVAVIPPGALLLAAGAALRSHRGENERVQIGLEQVLDRLERGEIRAEHRLPGARLGAFGRIAEELKKAFQD